MTSMRFILVFVAASLVEAIFYYIGFRRGSSREAARGEHSRKRAFDEMLNEHQNVTASRDHWKRVAIKTQRSYRELQESFRLLHDSSLKARGNAAVLEQLGPIEDPITVGEADRRAVQRRKEAEDGKTPNDYVPVVFASEDVAPPARISGEEEAD